MYIEIVLGKLSNRHQIFHIDKLQDCIKYAFENNIELYRSYYLYPEEILNWKKNNQNKITNFTGSFSILNIILDIDKGKYTNDEVKHNAILFYDKLIKFGIFEENIKIYYSGTGYHFEIPDIFNIPQNNQLPKVLETTLLHYFPESDSIYYPVSLIRCNDTLNLKSNLYKIQITSEELLSLSSVGIMELAKTPFRDFIDNVTIVQDFSDRIILQKNIQKIEHNNFNRDTSNKNVICMQTVYNKGGIEGRRHKDALRLVSWMHRQGIPKQGIPGLIKQWSPGLPDTEITKLVYNVTKIPLIYGCNDEVMLEHCDSNCIFYAHKNYNVPIMDSKTMEMSFTSFIINDIGEKTFDLNEIFDKSSSYMFYPGELVIFLGDTGIGKTAIVQNIVTSLSRLTTLYLSFEVGQNLLYRRFIQISHGMNKYEVIKHYQENNNTLSNSIKHIYCTDKQLSIDQIKEMVRTIKPNILVIDTLDGVVIKSNDMNFKLDKIANSLKELAIQEDIIILGIHHISKGSAIDISGRPIPLNKHSGKYASAIEQKADKVIGIEIPFIDGKQLPPDSLKRTIKSLKSRDEHNINIIVDIDFTTFQTKQEGVSNA